jgi:hypothetical protein
MDNKRKTLAGLTLNQVNSRASLAPGRLNKEGKLKNLSLGGRPSVIGTKGSIAGLNASSRLAVPAGAVPRRYWSDNLPLDAERLKK